MLRHLRWFDVDGERKYASDWARQWGVSHHTAVNKLELMVKQGQAYEC